MARRAIREEPMHNDTPHAHFPANFWTGMQGIVVAVESGMWVSKNMILKFSWEAGQRTDKGTLYYQWSALRRPRPGFYAEWGS